jgi:hypothetical protein
MITEADDSHKYARTAAISTPHGVKSRLLQIPVIMTAVTPITNSGP